jgi:hypothetical protein
MKSRKGKWLLVFIACFVVFCVMALQSNENILSYDELSDMMYLEASENPENELFIPLNPLQNNNNVSNLLGCREKTNAYIFERGEVVPIFIISYNRYRALRMTISSFQRLTDPIQLYIIDFHSTHDSMINYLNFLSRQKNIFVINIKENLGLENLERIGNITQNILSTLKANYYIVTDPDIVLASSPDLIQYYITVLEACPQLGGIGCGLSIFDLPSSQWMSDVYNYEMDFWRNFSSLTWKGILTQFYYAPVDTTFLMHRREHTYRRLIPKTVRTGLISLFISLNHINYISKIVIRS